MKNEKWILLLLSLGTLTMSCDSAPNNSGTGQLTITTWGEEFIENGIPAHEFEDGWTVVFDKFIVLLQDVTTGPEGSSDSALVAVDGCAAFDLVNPGPVSIAQLDTDSGTYNETAYTIAPAKSCSHPINTAAFEDVEMMTSKGYAVFISGTASKEGETKSFAWGFSEPVHYAHCHSTAILKPDGQATIELTIHGDHFFYTSLSNPDSGLAFQTLADADSNHDDELTTDELKEFTGTDFMALDNYDVGSLPVTNLYEYLAAQSSTLGHIDGEGHCETAPHQSLQ
jgi:hypothetical protein